MKKVEIQEKLSPGLIVKISSRMFESIIVDNSIRNGYKKDIQLTQQMLDNVAYHAKDNSHPWVWHFEKNDN